MKSNLWLLWSITFNWICMCLDDSNKTVSSPPMNHDKYYTKKTMSNSDEKNVFMQRTYLLWKSKQNHKKFCVQRNNASTILCSSTIPTWNHTAEWSVFTARQSCTHILGFLIIQDIVGLHSYLWWHRYIVVSNNNANILQQVNKHRRNLRLRLLEFQTIFMGYDGKGTALLTKLWVNVFGCCVHVSTSY